MPKPSIYVGSKASRMDRPSRQKLIDEFNRDRSVVSSNEAHIVEVLNHCIERFIPFSVVWGANITIKRTGVDR